MTSTCFNLKEYQVYMGLPKQAYVQSETSKKPFIGQLTKAIT